jgi:glucose-1-phosphate cytidylyltransferase
VRSIVKTLILCGGKGTRAYPHTIDLPKPLLEVAERPVLHHVLDLYARQGLDDFVLAAGFRCDLIEEFVANLRESWRIQVVDTGEEANTGERVFACRDLLGDRFLATYADGLGSVDLHALVAFHAAHGRSATLTSVPLPSQYGTIDFEGGGRVMRFREKPRLPDHRINAGFFVFDRRVFDKWEGVDLEREVLPALASAGELFAYPHEGFWKSMDTYKDALELSALCQNDEPPWLARPGP